MFLTIKKNKLKLFCHMSTVHSLRQITFMKFIMKLLSNCVNHLSICSIFNFEVLDLFARNIGFVPLHRFVERNMSLQNIQ